MLHDPVANQSWRWLVQCWWSTTACLTCSAYDNVAAALLGRETLGHVNGLVEVSLVGGLDLIDSPAMGRQQAGFLGEIDHASVDMVEVEAGS
jgi:hypothetical protein